MTSAPVSTEQLRQRLEMTHLVSPDELKTQIEAAMSPPVEEEEDTSNPRLEERYTFEFNHKDQRGKVWKGTFVNKALTLGERQMVGHLRARLNHPYTIEQLDALTNEINLIIAHLTFSLQEKPKWAQDLRSLHQFEVLQALYAEVALHEDIFLGYQKATRPREEEPQDRNRTVPSVVGQ